LNVSIPGPANTTCDIYRAGNAPPAPPDVAAVPCRFDPDYRRGLEKGEGDTVGKFSAVLVVDLGTDVRDDYNGGSYGPNADLVVVPSQVGMAYNVRFVERRGRGTPHDHLRVYLVRSAVSWPTTEV
jgi:hypothetical protein